MASLSSETIRKCTAEINQALAYNVDLVWFANRLYAEGFITQDQQSKVNSTSDKSTMANMLMNSVMSQVKITPSKYNDFIRILKEERALNFVVQRLEKTYGKD